MTKEEFSSLFKSSGLTLGSAESFTGGLFAGEIVSISGASKFFKGAIVTYATEIKANVLHVEQDIIDNFGVVSSECAKDMAKKARTLLNVDIAVSFTGNAGPDVMENKEAGLIYIGVATKDKTEAFEYKMNGNRDEVRRNSIKESYKLLAELIK